MSEPRKPDETQSLLAASRLNELEDGLLVEILQRIPTTKFAFQCKLVSKKWCTLLSSPYFISRFVAYHTKHDADIDNDDAITEYKKPCGLLIWYLRVASVNPIYRFPGFTLSSYLPENRYSCMVKASCNDLILGVPHENAQDFRKPIEGYYVCNPFTMKWVHFPPLATKHVTEDDGYTEFGFVCEPYYGENGLGKYVINADYRFKVVRFSCKEEENKCVMEMYCSETGKWSEPVTFTGAEYRFETEIVAFNGRLHWFNGKKIVVYDPLKTGEFCFIDCPNFNDVDGNDGLAVYNLGVCRGYMRLMRMLVHNNEITENLGIWELEDDGKSKWSLKHLVSLQTFVTKNSWLKQALESCRLRVFPLAFHPSDRNIVYLNFNGNGVTCFIKSKEWRRDAYFEYRIGRVKALPLMQSWWPTPVPTIPGNSTDVN